LSDTDDYAKSFAEVFIASSDAQRGSSSMRYLLRELIKKLESEGKDSIDQSEILELMYEQINEEAEERDDPMIAFFAHIVASYYDLALTCSLGDQSIDNLRARYEYLTTGKITTKKPKLELVKPQIILPS
jgi:hypothetical protein